MKKLFLICISLLFQLVAYSQSDIKSICDKLVKEYLEKNKGALVIGICKNGTQQIFYYDETENGNAIKPDSNSVFEIGNITETFTSILYADQMIKGKIHDDDKLSDYLPVDVAAPVFQNVICEPYKAEDEIGYGNSKEGDMRVRFTPYVCRPDTSSKPQPILICYLGTHTSGLPDKPFNFHRKDKANPYADYATEDLYKFLREYRLINPIGFDYKHSELGIAILGKAISLKLGKEYEKLLIENILDTLQMYDTRITLNKFQKEKFVTGYSANGKKAKSWTSDVYSPVIGLHSTPKDMMLFLSANISTGKNNLIDVLNYTHKPRLKTGNIPSKGMEIALGWKINPTSDVKNKIVWQSGVTGGFASYIGFIEKNHTGVFVLSSVSKEVNSLGEFIMQSIGQ